jgi:transcriptional regulator with XRE-family HTH domain
VKFNPEKLRDMRKSQGIALKELAARLDVSAAQVQRLERGQRRLTVDMFLNYCEALGVDAVDLIQERPFVPIIGIINNELEVVPLEPNTPHEAMAPRIISDPHNLAAVRWSSSGMFSTMKDHLMFFRVDTESIPDVAWGQRCIIRRSNGSQRIGWLIGKDGQIHINESFGDAEFNADVIWASPILAVVPPFLAK